MKIDFVITWVNEKDPKWLKEKSQYQCCGDNNIGRYRDWDLLRYWFRAVEKYASWVNKIHFVTYGHLPIWLNTENKKINIVKHSDFIPQKYLPTFSSHPIELNLHLIPDLADKFVYFNDDVFLNSMVQKEDFFINSFPCDSLQLTPIISERYNDIFPHILLNNNSIINEMFTKNELRKTILLSSKYSIRQNITNFILSKRNNITGFRFFHLGQPFLRTSFIELWESYPNLLDDTCKHKFRSIFDVSPYLIRDIQLMKGNFVPIGFNGRGQLFEAGKDNRKIERALVSNDKMICINDSYCDNEHFLIYKKELNDILVKKFPDKSTFEI